jgi:hypothetical protein
VDPIPPGGDLNAVLWFGPMLSFLVVVAMSGAILATQRNLLDGLEIRRNGSRSIP